MTFLFEGKFFFEADGIDETLLELSKYFLDLFESGKNVNLLPNTKIEITPVEILSNECLRMLEYPVIICDKQTGTYSGLI